MDHGAGGIAQHPRLVGGRLAPGRTGEEVREQVVRHHVGPPGLGPHLVGGPIRVDDAGVAQVPADLLDHPRGVEHLCRLGGQGGDEAGGHRRAEEGGQRLGGPFDREVLAVEEVEGDGSHAGPVTGGGAGLGRERRLGLGAARTALGRRPVLSALQGERHRSVEDLADLDVFDRSVRQVGAARRAALRLVIDDLGGVVALFQRGARCPGLLAPLAGELLFAGGLGRCAPFGAILGRLCLVLDGVRRRRERRVLRAAPRTALELGDHELEPLDLVGLGGHQRPKSPDLGFEQLHGGLRHARKSSRLTIISRMPRSGDHSIRHGCSSPTARSRRCAHAAARRPECLPPK